MMLDTLETLFMGCATYMNYIHVTETNTMFNAMRT